jgi:hypothetical protein
MPARRALLIACDEFQDSSFENLTFPRTDAERLSAALSNEKLCFFDDAQVLQNPSLQDVRRSVYRMATAAERDDLILLYYSGHGALDQDGSLALILPNTEADLLGATSLVADDIKRAFNQSRAAQKVLIFDCCYAGAVGSAKMKGSAASSLQSLAQETSGTYILTASTRFQPAYEQSELGGSVLTSCLLEGVVKGEAANDADEVTLSALASYVKAQAPKYGAQQPQYWAMASGGEVIFARRAESYDDAWREQANQLVMRHHLDGNIERERERELRLAIDAPVEPGTLAAKELIDELLKKKIGLMRFAVRWAALQAPPPPVVEPVVAPVVEPPAPAATAAGPVVEEPPPFLEDDLAAEEIAAAEPAPARPPPDVAPTFMGETPRPRPAARPYRVPRFAAGGFAFFTLACMPFTRGGNDMFQLAALLGMLGYCLSGIVLLASVARSKTYAQSPDERHAVDQVLLAVNGPPILIMLWFMLFEHPTLSVLIMGVAFGIPSLIYMALRAKPGRTISGKL